MYHPKDVKVLEAAKKLIPWVVLESCVTMYNILNWQIWKASHAVNTPIALLQFCYEISMDLTLCLLVHKCNRLDGTQRIFIELSVKIFCWFFEQIIFVALWHRYDVCEKMSRLQTIGKRNADLNTMVLIYSLNNFSQISLFNMIFYP